MVGIVTSAGQRGKKFGQALGLRRTGATVTIGQVGEGFFFLARDYVGGKGESVIRVEVAVLVGGVSQGRSHGIAQVFDVPGRLPAGDLELPGDRPGVGISSLPDTDIDPMQAMEIAHFLMFL